MNKISAILIVLIFNSTFFQAQENVLWKFKTNNRVYASALIVHDVVYFGSGDQSFYAVEKNTGKKIWEFKTQGSVHSSAAIHQNLIYFGSADGNLYALDKTTGKLIWKFASEGEKSYGVWDYYLSSPKVSNGTIFWGSGDGHLYAIDVIKGTIKWKFKTNDIVHASPVIDGDKVYFGSFDGYFYTLNKATGNVIWKFDTIGEKYFPKGEIQKSALVHDGLVYFGSRDYNIYALDAISGEKKWNMKDEGGWITATPLAFKNNVYVGASDGHVFYAFDKRSGSLKWKTPIPMRAYGTAVSHNDIIYFGTFDGKILGLDYETGALKWEFQTEKSKQNYASIYNSEGHFKKDFELYGENYLDSEAKIHELGSILSTPVIEGNTIYFGSSDGYFYAVKLNE